MRETIVPADEVSLPALAALWNRGYDGYFVPATMSEAQFRDHVRRGQIDVSRSLLLLIDDEPAGFSLLGIRGDRGWIGGFGIASEHRRRGHAHRLFAEHLRRFARMGLRTAQLEVLVENWAYKVYAAAGMRTTRRLSMLRGTLAARPADTRAILTRPGELHGHSERLHGRWYPVWQREPPWLERLPEEELAAVRLGTAARPSAYLIYRVLPEGRLSIVDAAAESAAAAVSLVSALAEDHPGSETTIVNEPAGSPFHRALLSAGCSEVKAQWEMGWTAPGPGALTDSI